MCGLLTCGANPQLRAADGVMFFECWQLEVDEDEDEEGDEEEEEEEEDEEEEEEEEGREKEEEEEEEGEEQEQDSPSRRLGTFKPQTHRRGTSPRGAVRSADESREHGGAGPRREEREEAPRAGAASKRRPRVARVRRRDRKREPLGSTHANLRNTTQNDPFLAWNA